MIQVVMVLMVVVMVLMVVVTMMMMVVMVELMVELMVMVVVNLELLMMVKAAEVQAFHPIPQLAVSSLPLTTQSRERRIKFKLKLRIQTFLCSSPLGDLFAFPWASSTRPTMNLFRASHQWRSRLFCFSNYLFNYTAHLIYTPL
jgi:hypothetical protein